MSETAVIEQPTSAAVEAPASAPAAPSTDTVSTPSSSEGAGRTAPSYQERADALRGKARDHYRLTGDLHAAEQLGTKTKKSDASAASSTATPDPGAPSAQTEAASGTAEPKPTRQDRDWKNLRDKVSTYERELTATKAKLEVYEREHARSGTSAPATTPDQAKPQAASEPRPEFPDINSFNDPKKFQDAVKAWQTKDSEWVQRQFDQRFAGEQAKQTHEQAVQQWNTQLTEARKVHTDFDDVAFSPQTPLSYATLGEIQSMGDGALRSYALGKNLAEATRIAELTHIPGEANFKSFAEFMRWVESHPQVAMLYGEKRALAKIELQKLTVGKASAPPQPKTTPKPLKEVLANQPRPSAEVNVEENAGPVQDPAAQALKNRDFETYKRLKNEEDRRRMQAR